MTLEWKTPKTLHSWGHSSPLHISLF